jgi:hypothetical protein
VRSWRRAVLGVVLVGAIAIAGIALNFTLLRLTQDAHDPVGKLSPRAVFAPQEPTTGTVELEPPPVTTTGDGGNGGRGDRDSDD